MFDRLCRQDPLGSTANACNVSLKGSFSLCYLRLEAITGLVSQMGKGVEGILGLTAPACRIWPEDSFLEADIGLSDGPLGEIPLWMVLCVGSLMLKHGCLTRLAGP
jgi:hypothetical protein